MFRFFFSWSFFKEWSTMGSGCATRVISSGTGVASKQLLFVAVGIRQLSPISLFWPLKRWSLLKKWKMKRSKIAIYPYGKIARLKNHRCSLILFFMCQKHRAIPCCQLRYVTKSLWKDKSRYFSKALAGDSKNYCYQASQCSSSPVKTLLKMQNISLFSCLSLGRTQSWLGMGNVFPEEQVISGQNQVWLKWICLMNFTENKWRQKFEKIKKFCFDFFKWSIQIYLFQNDICFTICIYFSSFIREKKHFYCG